MKSIRKGDLCIVVGQAHQPGCDTSCGLIVTVEDGPRQGAVQCRQCEEYVEHDRLYFVRGGDREGWIEHFRLKRIDPLPKEKDREKPEEVAA